MKNKKRNIILASLAGLMLTSAHAQTVAWGTSVSENPLSFTSDGAVDNAVLDWELGWFSDGYTPTAANWSTWAANWNPVNYESGGSLGDRAHMNYDGLWTVSVNTSDVGAAAAGKQVYMFAHNDVSLFGTADGEALLFREDGLLFPTIPNQITFDIADNPLDTNDDAFTVIWGRIDREMYNIGGVLEGAGVFGVKVADSAATPYDSVNGTFEAQSGTWAVIPEASTSLLGLLGAASLLRRKRSN